MYISSFFSDNYVLRQVLLVERLLTISDLDSPNLTNMVEKSATILALILIGPNRMLIPEPIAVSLFD